MTSNQTDPIEDEEEQLGEGGCSRDAEAEDKDEDNYEGEDKYNYQDNSKIYDLWYELQCGDVLSSGLITLHNHTTWIDL